MFSLEPAYRYTWLLWSAAFLVPWAAVYRALARAPERRFDGVARRGARHRWHGAALTSPFLVFFALLPLPWNPIYAGIGALLAGALTTLLCRPDLTRGAVIGGLLVFAIYGVFLLGLKWLWPGYIEAVWNLPDLLPWRPGGLPLEELMFGFAFGMYWSSVYEHIAWRQHGARQPRVGRASATSALQAEPLKSSRGQRVA